MVVLCCVFFFCSVSFLSLCSCSALSTRDCSCMLHAFPAEAVDILWKKAFPQVVLCQYCSVYLEGVSKFVYRKRSFSLYFRIGNFEGDIEWEKMLALACTALEKVQVHI